MQNKIILSAVLVAAACGSSAKNSGLNKGGDVPPPPPVVKNEPAPGDKAAKPEPKREVSKDAKADYQAAMQSFKDSDKGSWNESSCRASAEKFAAVAREHSELVEAQVMVGLSYERCGLLKDAENAYQAATHMKGDPTKIALATSNLGELYYKAGKIDGAKQYWDAAIKQNGKLVGARINVASFELDQMRKINNPKDANWKKLEEDARFNLSSALAVETDNVDAYTVFGLIYMEGWQNNKNRLDLAKTLMDEGKKRNEKYAPLQNAYGLYYMHKGALNQAAQSFAAAVAADPKFVEARVNAGLLNVGFRKYDVAKEMFAAAIEVAPKNYDATIGLGIALRGLKDLDGAEAAYKKARDIDARKGDSYFNLGVLYKDFRATKQSDLAASVNTYKQARDFFQQFMDKDGDAADKDEAKKNIADCDKTVKQIQQFIANQAAMPQAPAAPAAPAAGAGAGSGSGSANAPKQ